MDNRERERTQSSGSGQCYGRYTSLLLAPEEGAHGAECLKGKHAPVDIFECGAYMAQQSEGSERLTLGLDGLEQLLALELKTRHDIGATIKKLVVAIAFPAIDLMGWERSSARKHFHRSRVRGFRKG